MQILFRDCSNVVVCALLLTEQRLHRGEGRPINRYAVDWLRCSFSPFWIFDSCQIMFAYSKLRTVTATATTWHNILQCRFFLLLLLTGTFVALIKDAEIEFLATKKPSKNERLNKNAKWKWWQIRCTSLNKLNWKILRFSIHQPSQARRVLEITYFSFFPFLLQLSCVRFFISETSI